MIRAAHKTPSYGLTARACLGFWCMKQMIEMGVLLHFPIPIPYGCSFIAGLSPTVYHWHSFMYLVERNNKQCDRGWSSLFKQTKGWQDQLFKSLDGAIHWMNTTKSYWVIQWTTLMHPLSNMGQVSNSWPCNLRLQCILIIKHRALIKRGFSAILNLTHTCLAIKWNSVNGTLYPHIKNAWSNCRMPTCFSSFSCGSQPVLNLCWAI